jgi:pimeloyl-ACP methyl ester carboxylesterase
LTHSAVKTSRILSGKKRMARIFLTLVFALISETGFAASFPAKPLEYSAQPDATNNFAEASFACVLPSQNPRAILFLAGGTDSDARPWLNDARWRALAEKERLVLIAACLRGAGEPYELASQGSGQALVDAIASFAKLGACLELTRLPLILSGHSAGAMFAFNFACWKPERVRAIVGVKSGPISMPPLLGMPRFQGLFIVGERDAPGRIRTVAQTFTAGRAMGAPWCLAFQPNVGHDFENCRPLVEAFIEAVDSTTPQRSSYAELSAPNNLSLAKTSAATNPNSTWLPDAPFSQAWRGFVKPVELQHLQSLADDPPQRQLSWSSITTLPDPFDVSRPRATFEYLVSRPDDSASMTQATVKPSNPAISATITRRSSREFSVAGECDFRRMPLGPFKCEFQVELLTASGVRECSEFTLFTHLTGPISISPPSLYYGVIPRNTTTEFELTLRSEPTHPIRSFEAISSDPAFLNAAIAPSKTSHEYMVKCFLRSGARVGEKNGHLTLRVEADHPYLIDVPFYGFIKK